MSFSNEKKSPVEQGSPVIQRPLHISLISMPFDFVQKKLEIILMESNNFIKQKKYKKCYSYLDQIYFKVKDSPQLPIYYKIKINKKIWYSLMKIIEGYLIKLQFDKDPLKMQKFDKIFMRINQCMQQQYDLLGIFYIRKKKFLQKYYQISENQQINVLQYQMSEISNDEEEKQADSDCDQEINTNKNSTNLHNTNNFSENCKNSQNLLNSKLTKQNGQSSQKNNSKNSSIEKKQIQTDSAGKNQQNIRLKKVINNNFLKENGKELDNGSILDSENNDRNPRNRKNLSVNTSFKQEFGNSSNKHRIKNNEKKVKNNEKFLENDDNLSNYSENSQIQYEDDVYEAEDFKHLNENQDSFYEPKNYIKTKLVKQQFIKLNFKKEIKKYFTMTIKLLELKGIFYKQNKQFKDYYQHIYMSVNFAQKLYDMDTFNLDNINLLLKMNMILASFYYEAGKTDQAINLSENMYEKAMLEVICRYKEYLDDFQQTKKRRKFRKSLKITIQILFNLSLFYQQLQNYERAVQAIDLAQYLSETFLSSQDEYKIFVDKVVRETESRLKRYYEESQEINEMVKNLILKDKRWVQLQMIKQEEIDEEQEKQSFKQVVANFQKKFDYNYLSKHLYIKTKFKDNQQEEQLQTEQDIEQEKIMKAQKLNKQIKSLVNKANLPVQRKNIRSISTSNQNKIQNENESQIQMQQSQLQTQQSQLEISLRHSQSQSQPKFDKKQQNCFLDLIEKKIFKNEEKGRFSQANIYLENKNERQKFKNEKDIKKKVGDKDYNIMEEKINQLIYNKINKENPSLNMDYLDRNYQKFQIENKEFQKIINIDKRMLRIKQIENGRMVQNNKLMENNDFLTTLGLDSNIRDEDLFQKALVYAKNNSENYQKQKLRKTLDTIGRIKRSQRCFTASKNQLNSVDFCQFSHQNYHSNNRTQVHESRNSVDMMGQSINRLNSTRRIGYDGQSTNKNHLQRGATEANQTSRKTWGENKSQLNLAHLNELDEESDKEKNQNKNINNKEKGKNLYMKLWKNIILKNFDVFPLRNYRFIQKERKKKMIKDIKKEQKQKMNKNLQQLQNMVNNNTMSSQNQSTVQNTRNFGVNNNNSQVSSIRGKNSRNQNPRPSQRLRAQSLSTIVLAEFQNYKEFQDDGDINEEFDSSFAISEDEKEFKTDEQKMKEERKKSKALIHFVADLYETEKDKGTHFIIQNEFNKSKIVKQKRSLSMNNYNQQKKKNRTEQSQNQLKYQKSTITTSNNSAVEMNNSSKNLLAVSSIIKNMNKMNTNNAEQNSQQFSRSQEDINRSMIYGTQFKKTQQNQNKKLAFVGQMNQLSKSTKYYRCYNKELQNEQGLLSVAMQKYYRTKRDQFQSALKNKQERVEKFVKLLKDKSLDKLKKSIDMQKQNLKNEESEQQKQNQNQVFSQNQISNQEFTPVKQNSKNYKQSSQSQNFNNFNSRYEMSTQANIYDTQESLNLINSRILRSNLLSQDKFSMGNQRYQNNIMTQQDFNKFNTIVNDSSNLNNFNIQNKNKNSQSQIQNKSKNGIKDEKNNYKNKNNDLNFNNNFIALKQFSVQQKSEFQRVGSISQNNSMVKSQNSTINKKQQNQGIHKQVYGSQSFQNKYQNQNNNNFYLNKYNENNKKRPQTAKKEKMIQRQQSALIQEIQDYAK